MRMLGVVALLSLACACGGAGGETAAPKTYAYPQGSNCPAGFPIKATNDGAYGSEYFSPGNGAYDGLKPLLCYVNKEAAQKGGYRQSPFDPFG